jgi:GH15 family glucan-1,4-alpha-glucosidase
MSLSNHKVGSDQFYAWPRVGAFALWPLIRLGYTDEPLRFFDFCLRTLRPEGYFLERYHADGSPGSSSFARIENGKAVDPTALDQAAVVLFLFSEYHRFHNDSKLLQTYYKKLVAPIADYLASSLDRQSGLPKTRYNIWNEPNESSVYTTSVVYAALGVAADIAEEMDDQVKVVSWRTIADEIYESAQKQMDDRLYGFNTIDAADIFGSFIFGLTSVDNPKLQQSVEQAVELFNASGQCGLAKYARGDARNDSPERWIVPTLWYAEYCLEKGDEQTAEIILSWVESCASSTNLLPDKVSSCDNTLFECPSVWSHAEYITALLDSMTEIHARYE